MSNLKDKVESAVDSAAEATKKAGAVVADKTKDATHATGKKVEHAGKEMRNA